MFQKLDDVVLKHKELTKMLMDPEVVSDPKKIMEYNKALNSLDEVVRKYTYYKNRREEMEGLKEDLKSEKDAEMKEMMHEEIHLIEEEIPHLEEELKVLLLPKDPNDDKNVIMEIRGGAGGDEGNIFAGDLYRMYSKYAESKGWKVQVLEASVSEAGGYTQIIFSVKGTDVYKELKFESGVHRVQRVPKTETQGRIHTSTATVLCQPEAEDTDIEIDPKDLTIETHRASGAGGQHINKTDSAVRIVHVPTGITVNCQDGRSQIENRETAMRLIRARVYEELKRIQEEEAGKIRRAKIGTGDRSEKIRTYNYPQNRVTDHRIGLTITQLDRIMEGKLDGVIEGLLAEEEKRKLEETAV